MLDVKKTFKERSDELFSTGSIQKFLSEIIEFTKFEIRDHDFNDNSPEELFPEYFTADKRLASPDEIDALMIVSIKALSYLQIKDIPEAFRLSMAKIVASAQREVAFAETIRDHNSIDTVDERLASIEAADHVLELFSNLLEPDSGEYHRMQLDRGFTRVHMDIVCGEVTNDTVSETLEMLKNRRLATFNISNVTVANGVKGEIEVLEFIWQQYKKKGDAVGIPATVRGQSGRSLPHQTHDIDVIRQKNDGSWISLAPIEVKRSEITESMRRRYTSSVLAQVALDGSITFHTDHRVH